MELQHPKSGRAFASFAVDWRIIIMLACQLDRLFFTLVAGFKANFSTLIYFAFGFIQQRPVQMTAVQITSVVKPTALVSAKKTDTSCSTIANAPATGVTLPRIWVGTKTRIWVGP